MARRIRRGLHPGLVAMWLIMGAVFLVAVFVVIGDSIFKIAQCMG
jgi:hypothetical protein